MFHEKCFYLFFLTFWFLPRDPSCTFQEPFVSLPWAVVHPPWTFREPSCTFHEPFVSPSWAFHESFIMSCQPFMSTPWTFPHSNLFELSFSPRSIAKVKSNPCPNNYVLWGAREASGCCGPVRSVSSTSLILTLWIFWPIWKKSPRNYSENEAKSRISKFQNGFSRRKIIFFSNRSKNS